MSDRRKVPYPIKGPFLDKSKPSTQIQPGTFSDLIGVDGRFMGGLRKFYGMKLVKELRDIVGLETLTNITYFEMVTIQKPLEAGGTVPIRGFVVRWGNDLSAQTISFAFYDLSAATPDWKAITLSTDIDYLRLMDVDTYDTTLYLAVQGLDMKVLYYDTDTSEWKIVAAGPGEFHDSTGGITVLPPSWDEVQNKEDGGQLQSNKSYQIAFRFTNPVRDVYSCMSEYLQANITTMETAPDEVGETTQEARSDISINVKLPQLYVDATTTPNVDERYTYENISELFTNIEVYRTISMDGGGIVLYKETTIDLPSETEYGTLEIPVGKLQDDVLVTNKRYDSWLDVVAPVPKAGTIKVYEGCLFASDSPDVKGGIRTLFSSPGNESLEYFTSRGFNAGNNKDGVPTRLEMAGDTLYIATRNSLTMVVKKGTVVRFIRLHIGRGLLGYKAIHSVGNDILLLTSLGFGTVDGQRGNMDIFSTLTRIVNREWVSDLEDIDSCYDSEHAASFFLNPSKSEILAIWHGTSVATTLKLANFVACTEGVIPDDPGISRAFFVTSTGRIVTPDWKAEGPGTMSGVSNYGDMQIVSTSGTHIGLNTSVDAEVKGSFIYFPNGQLEGQYARIVDVISPTFIAVDRVIPSIQGQQIVISPVIFRAKAWALPIWVDDRSRVAVEFLRKNITGISLSAKDLSGFENNPIDFWRVGVHCNGSAEPTATTVDAKVKVDPSESITPINISDIYLEPMIEYAGVGVDFELTGLEVSVTMTHSRLSTK